jgi:hypothetical protein
MAYYAISGSARFASGAWANRRSQRTRVIRMVRRAVAQRVRAKRGPMTGSGVTRHCRKAKTADYTELKSAYELYFALTSMGSHDTRPRIIRF